MGGDGRKNFLQKDWTAGNLGFDPLKLYEASPQKKRELELKEINNGRLAMLAITSFAAIEFITKLPSSISPPYSLAPSRWRARSPSASEISADSEGGDDDMSGWCHSWRCLHSKGRCRQHEHS